MTDEQREDTRVGIIKTVQTPLGFFVLVVLVVEVLLGGVAGLSEGLTPTVTVVGMLVVILALVAVVTFFAYHRPEALSGIRPDKTTVLDPAILSLMTYHSKEILTVIRAKSENGHVVHGTVIGANLVALRYFGFRPNQADRLIGQPSGFLLERLENWMDQEHFCEFIADQERVYANIDRGYELYAKVPMIIDERHPFEELHRRRFMPITLAHSEPVIIDGKRIEDILVGYFDIDHIVADISNSASQSREPEQ